MAYFISEEQFNGMFNLVIEDGSFFKEYADQWENIWVPRLIGWDLYNHYINNVGKPSMFDLKTQMEIVLKHFFYLDYQVEVESFASTVGNMSAKVENASRARQSRNAKAVKLFNIGCDLWDESYDYLDDLGDYPQLKAKKVIIEKLNVFGI
jgi:hypothetical protein